MRASLLVTMLLSLCYITNAQTETPRAKNVLFIGNQLTSANGMPAMLQKMLDEKKENYNIGQSTFADADLFTHVHKVKDGANWRKAGHVEASHTIQILNNYDWDYVVLQEATPQLLIHYARVFDYEPSAVTLDSIVKLRKGKTVLFQSFTHSTFPWYYCLPQESFRNYVDPGQCCSDTFRNSALEFDAINNIIERMSKKLKAPVAPVGLAFQLCAKKYPEIYIIENTIASQPAPAGAYLMACVFYKMLTKNKVSELKYSGKINKIDAKKIRALVDEM